MKMMDKMVLFKLQLGILAAVSWCLCQDLAGHTWKMLEDVPASIPAEGRVCPDTANASEWVSTGTLAETGGTTTDPALPASVTVARPAPAVNPVLSSRWGYGASRGVAVLGNYVCYGSGSVLEVVNISDPASPVLTGTLDAGAQILAVAADGNFAYLAAAGAGLVVVNLSNPAAPVRAGGLITASPVHRVAVSGTCACLLDAENLLVIDIANPAAPSLAATLHLPAPPQDVSVSGSHALVADGKEGLRIINIANPAAPAEAGLYKPSGFCIAVAAAGSYAYLADTDVGLWRINISDPANPVNAGSYYTVFLGGSDFFPRHVAVAYPYVYLAGELVYFIPSDSHYVPPDMGRKPVFQIISHDFNPYYPVGSLDLTNGAQELRVAVAGTAAYVTGGSGGLRILDISRPAKPARSGYLATPGTADGISITGAYACVTDEGEDGLRIFDLANPAEPAEIQFSGCEFQVLDSATDGTHAAIAGTYSRWILNGMMQWELRDYIRLAVFSLSNPVSLVQTGWIDSGGDAVKVTIRGDFVFQGVSVSSQETGSGGLEIIQITDSGLTRRGHLDFSAAVADVAAAGLYVYVLDKQGIFRVIDVSNPDLPGVAGTIQTPAAAGSVTVSGTRAYVSDPAGFFVIDISNPAAPALVGSADTPGSGSGVAVAGSCAFVADGEAGLRVIDVSNPAGPVETGSADTPGRAKGVAILNKQVMVADEFCGLSIFDVCAGLPETPAGLAAAGESPHTIGLNWNDILCEDEFLIERKTRPDEPYQQLARVPAGVTDYLDTGLAVNQTCWYRVAAINESGTSGYSNEAMAATLACAPPQIVTPPASQTVQTGATATLTVTATGYGPLSFQWYRGLSPDTGNPVDGATGSNFTTPVLRLTSPYWVRVTNECGSTDSPTATVSVYNQLGNFTLLGFLGVGQDRPERAVHIRDRNAVFRMDRSSNTAAFMLVRTNAAYQPLKTFVIGTDTIGAGTPGGEFAVNDLGAAVSGPGQRRLTIRDDGTAVFTGEVQATAFLTPSTRALKTNIRPLEGALEEILQLQGGRFRRGESGGPPAGPGTGGLGRPSIGLIAGGAGAGKAAAGPGYSLRPGLDEGRLTALLVEGFKQQQRELALLMEKRDRLKALLAELAELEKSLPAGRK